MKIEFIFPHCNARTYQLISAISCLCVQSDKNWTLNVVSDGETRDIAKIQEIFKSFENIRYTTLEKNYRDWGHTPRNVGVQMCEEEWVVMTGNDNYYVPHFVGKVRNEIVKNNELNFVYCDMLHNAYDYKFFDCSPATHRIDMGNMITRTKLTKEVPLDVTKLDADGFFVREYTNRYCTNPNQIKKIDSVLYVHN